MKQIYLSNSIVPKQKDVFGQAAIDFFKHGINLQIQVYADEFDTDYIPVEYLFRSYESMPIIEQKALAMASGKVLDVGAGVGSHSLYLQKEFQLEVNAIDQSPGSIAVAQKRGITKAAVANFFTYSSPEKFDTLLLLMNGIGIAGKIENLPLFFLQARKLLKSKGKIILDSSDLIYLFDEDELQKSTHYYGEMNYQIGYKNLISDPFDWLYIGFEELKKQAQKNNFSCQLLASGNHYDYLAELRPI